jgi:hypothetical protein
MALTNSHKMLILVVLLLILAFFIYKNCDSNKPEQFASMNASTSPYSNNSNNGSMPPYSNNDNNSVDSTISTNSNYSNMTSNSSASTGSTGSFASIASSEDDVSADDASADDASSDSDASSMANNLPLDYSMGVKTNVSVVPTDETLDIRRGKNANNTTLYKSMNYKDNVRGGSGDLDKFFIDGNVENTGNNTQFSASDNVSDKYAAYQKSSKTDEGLLPVEEKDWFEDVTPTKIKNRHLINIYRPVGVNTISSSLKNPSLDLRGTPANAKTVVSPFLNSSIEPDHNIRGLCI